MSPERVGGSPTTGRPRGGAAPATRRSARGPWVLRGLAAASLAVSGYLHLTLAQGPLVSGGQITIAGLYIAQGVVAGLVAAWLLVRARRPAWVAAGLVGLASLLAVVASVYVEIPAIGPFPVLYEPLWYPVKVLSAVTAGLPAAAALMVLGRRHR